MLPLRRLLRLRRTQGDNSSPTYGLNWNAPYTFFGLKQNNGVALQVHTNVEGCGWLWAGHDSLYILLLYAKLDVHVGV